MYRGMIISAALLAGCSGPSPEIQQETKERVMISAAQDLVRATLKDPESAQFRNDRIGEYQGKSVGCGEVNANNSFGGKSGFKRYVAASESAVVTEEAMDPAEFEKVWSQICM